MQRTIGNAATTALLQRVPAKASSRVGARMAAATQAIAYAKKILAFGAGDQSEAIAATNANSLFRMKVVRTDDFWVVDPKVWDLASAQPTAFLAAKVEIAQGGNAGEHQAVVFDYLRAMASGEQLTFCSTKDLDHPFVLIGDLDSDADADLAVADAWPTRATAVPWPDHFAYQADRSRVTRHQVAISDGKGAKDAMKAGIRLTPAGEEALKKKLTDQETQELLASERWSRSRRIWSHETTKRH